MPERVFHDDPEASRGAISERLSVVDHRMDQGEYGMAGEELESLRDLIAEAIREGYDALVDEPGFEVLQELVARMAERLFTIAEGE